MTEFREAVAVFDLDRTITRFGTFSPFLLYATFNKPWRYIFAPYVIVVMLIHKAGLLKRTRLKELILKMVAGRHHQELSKRSHRFADLLVKRCLRPKARAAIQKHKEAGHLLILVTASMDFYAEEIGRRLGFDAVVATPSVWDGEDRLSPKLADENCYGDAKLRYLAARIVELDGKLAGFERYAYTDHYTDVPLLEWATKPMVVAPKKKMKLIAEEKGYTVLDWD